MNRPRQGTVSGVLGTIALFVAASNPLAAASGADDPRQPVIQWDLVPGATTAVRVVNLPAATTNLMRSASATDPRWPTILTVRLVSTTAATPLDRPAIGGKYEILPGGTLRFVPQFPLDAARRYRAMFDPDGLAGDAPVVTAERAASPRLPAPPTVVTRVEPTADRLPANLLKFYLHFSGPMGRGDAYAHLTLVDAKGQSLDHPFLELGEELWDPTATRLTVLLDPGRIKRGLRPREELGPIFEPGRSYTLKVDPVWRDAQGQPLGQAAMKTFSTVAEDETSPDPHRWKITPPQAGSVEPLVIRFDDALDRATVASGLNLLDPDGNEVVGAATALLDGTGWQFAPSHGWLAGSYMVAINPDLEDLAGNSIRRPFEVDVQRDVAIIPAATQIRRPVLIGP